MTWVMKYCDLSVSFPVERLNTVIVAASHLDGDLSYYKQPILRFQLRRAQGARVSVGPRQGSGMTDSTTSPEHTNRLIDETSPYLLQHAHNPVDWYPWGEEALAKARDERRLIMLSIGYSSCHWCHVMERESFEDEAIAQLMNEHFINIKVDREERPDLDDIYMAATLAMNQGHGGWPMTVFLTPDLAPVFAGTYFPPDDRHGQPGFPSLLQRIAHAWQEDPASLQNGAAKLVGHLKAQRQATGTLSVGETELKLALSQYEAEFDETFGGFGPAPKFPAATGLSLLLRLHRRFDASQALQMVRKTLDAMARGGIYDQVGGGFSRYSTDAQWLVPHFEKMLYDNALLSTAYLEAYQVTEEPFYRRIVTETLDYVLREMTAPEGGFYSATDADSEGVEGKFFVWAPEEIEAVLGADDARLFSAFYDISDTGNWEGKSIPHTPRPVEDVALQFRLDPDVLQRRLDELRSKVYEARLERVHPGLDDKVLTAWNGMMVSAFAHASRVLRDNRYLEAATRAADFLLEELVDHDGALLRTYRNGKAHLHAYLEDYAFLSEALVDLYEVGGEVRYLCEAERLLDRTVTDFLDTESGSFFNTSTHHKELLMRFREGTDGATPSSNAVAAAALVRASYHLDRDDLKTIAVRAIRAYGGMIARHPRVFAKSLHVVDLLLEGPVELAVVGKPGSTDLEALRAEVAKHFLPNRIEAVVDPDRPGDDSRPLERGKTLVDGKAALYICRDYTCLAPIVDPAEAASALSSVKGARTDQVISAPLAGSATGAGTKRYAARFGERGYRSFGTTGLTTSAVGFGGYRVTDGIPEHRESLIRALLSGVNVVDTSTNYMDGGSERLIGSVIRELVEGSELLRDELVVVSKIGYVQGENHAIAAEREEQGNPYPDMVKIQEGLWHCIHPEFLNDQFQRSLERLELETLDVCLLHNPEYFLVAAAAEGVPLVRARDEFYRRIEAAFRFFEDQIAAGRLRWYGVSSNTIVSPATANASVSVSRLASAADAVAGEQHLCKVVQLPLNLFEVGAVHERNTGPGRSMSALEGAREAGFAVMVNRPLNAFTAGGMLRLTDVLPIEEDVDWDTQLERVGALEESFQERIVPSITAPPDALQPTEFFRWADRLRAIRTQLPGLEEWAQMEGQVSYTVARLSASLDQHLSGEAAEQWDSWRMRYFPELNKLMRAMRGASAMDARAKSEAIAARVDPALPVERGGESFSRKALWTVASTPGVTCVLNGMRSVEYVQDALGIMEWPALEDVDKVYGAASSEP
jgi:uncharacterized protein YyaL (SSP411 family)/aryl-alcohol dehydrogenase-like predicted oxidoreductase